MPSLYKYYKIASSIINYNLSLKYSTLHYNHTNLIFK